MRNRTLITNVTPALDGGKYFIKRIPGEQVNVSACIFADGEEAIHAAVLYKEASSKKWSEVAMTSQGEDNWTASFEVGNEGFYQYKIEAWVEDRRQFSTIFDQNLRVRVGRPKEMFSTWYQMFPRSASQTPGKHGTFKDCENQLPRIAEMGFDVLLLTPVYPIGVTNRKGKENIYTAEKNDVGSLWSVGGKEGGHKSVHPDLGNLKDFEKLVKAAAKQGIEIALDMGLRCSPDHPYVKEHPDWFYYAPDGTLDVEEIPPFSYRDIINFNFECDDWKNLWEELKSIILFWAEKGVRIFYGSTPHNKPFAFWQWLIKEVQDKYPDAIFVSGAITRPRVVNELAKTGFAQSFTSFIWKNSKDDFQKFMEDLTRSETREYLRPNFFTNTPDILPKELTGAGESSFMLRYALAATLSSNSGVYGPAFELMQNTEKPGSIQEYQHSEKYEIRNHDWAGRNRVTSFITKLNRLRHTHPALQNTFNISFTKTDNDQLLSFVKSSPDGSDVIWCVINLDPNNKQSGYAEVPKEALGIKGRWFNLKVTDLLTNEIYHWFNEWNFVELKPELYPMHVLKVEF